MACNGRVWKHWLKTENSFDMLWQPLTEKQPLHSGGLLSLAKQKENQLVGFQPFHQAPPLYQTFSKISRIKLELSNNMHLASANAKSAIMNEYHCAHARKLGEAVSYCTVQIFFDLACLHPSRFGKPWGKGAKGSWLSQRQHSGETSGWTLKRGVERGKTWENKRDRQKHENDMDCRGKNRGNELQLGEHDKGEGLEMKRGETSGHESVSKAHTAKWRTFAGRNRDPSFQVLQHVPHPTLSSVVRHKTFFVWGQALPLHQAGGSVP